MPSTLGSTADSPPGESSGLPGSSSTAAKAASDVGGAAPPSVLVVDDNDAVARGLQTVLTQAGFRVAAFQAGLEALRFAQDSPPAAAVIDVHLPDINGLVLTQRLRDRLGPGVPLIVLSGDTSMCTLNSLPHVGATYFLAKPVSGNHLVARLREWMGAGQDGG